MSAFNAPRRKPAQPQYPMSSIVDLGGMDTPPHFPPLSYHPESDMRSKPNDYMPPQEVVARPHLRPEIDPDSAIYTSSDEDTLEHLSPKDQQNYTYPTWTPINNPSERPRKLPLDLAAFSLRNGYTIANAELRMNEIFEDEFENVDRKDGLVYHQGHKFQDDDGRGTSYSFVWVDDDPDILPAQVKQWKDKETRKHRSSEGPALEHGVRRMLETGSALLVERVGDEPLSGLVSPTRFYAFDKETQAQAEERSLDITETQISPEHFEEEFDGDSDAEGQFNMVSPSIGPQIPASGYQCILPDCRYGMERLPPRHFYLTLRPGQEAWPLSGPFCFCLPCFERLWMGHFSGDSQPGPAGIRIRRDSHTQPPPAESPADSSPRSDIPVEYPNEINLDGAINETSKEDPSYFSSLTSSRHAPPEIASSPVHQMLSDESNASNDSPSSINSQGEWIAHVHRVQHLAAFFKPGKSLTEVETAAVNLWKAASFEQLQWDVHQLKTKYRREYQAGDSLVDRSLNMDEFWIEDVDGEFVDEGKVEAVVGLLKSRLRGCSLADVWIAMRKEGAGGGFV